LDFTYDEAAAERAVEFFRRYLRHAKGELAGQRFELAEWQANEIIRPLFGWKRTSDNTRKHRTVYVEVGRGSGKTTLAAGLALYLLLCDGEIGGEIVSAAVDREQARIAFDLARQMVEAEPALRQRCKVYKNSIVVPSTNSVYKVLSADAKSKHGFSCSGIIFDEVAQQPNADLYHTLHTSTGKRLQPVEFLITTAGIHDPESIGWQLHSYAEQVKTGVVDDPSFLPVIFAASPEDDIQDPETWGKANPNYPISPRHDYMEAEAKKASQQAGYYNVFVRLHLGIWTQQATRWVNPDQWNACEREFPDLTGRECYGGLDLSTTTDISALSLIFPPLDESEPYFVLPFFWVPESKLSEKRDRVPFDQWRKQGYLSVTEGDVIDYDHIRRDVTELAAKYNIVSIAFDPWNSTQIATQLAEQDGLNLVQHRQGFVSMNEPSKEFERLILSRKIAHNANPVMRWMVNNVAIKTDPAGNIKPDKTKSTERIDAVVATIMALSRVMTHAETSEPQVYSL